ncbi:MAG: DUF4290 domain-containing protein [Salinivirgaceae bacterium]|nr:DUF4290 domain-containing protein [Salinivirgaceae bacterium]MDD4747177.1 DUF4290 domain-containing protein [Salinivirgaceae bacterium]MDY0280607.1 DUF4290 domain-containing protein [Salinivirgaceae bacterium]
MDYNTERESLRLPEYGRYIHEYVQQIKAMSTKEERTKAAHSLITVMGNLNPSLKDTSDYKRKLWDHLIIISNFELDVDNPFPMPDKELLEEKPHAVGYNSGKIMRRHYGKLVERMASHIVDYEGEEREILISLVANTMKKNYLNWNKNVVNDSTIIQDLQHLTPDEVVIQDNLQLSEIKDLVSKQKNPPKNIPKQQNKYKNRKTIKKTK